VEWEGVGEGTDDVDGCVEEDPDPSLVFDPSLAFDPSLVFDPSSFLDDLEEARASVL
jgi:hypothetical protein